MLSIIVCFQIKYSINTLSSSPNSGGIMKTIVLACVGAVVSFTVSLFLKWIWKTLREPQRKK